MALLIQLIDLLYWILVLAIIARAVLSWVRTDPYNPFVRIIVQITEPILAPIRRVLPATAGLDFSPLIAIIGLDILHRLLITLLLSL